MRKSAAWATGLIPLCLGVAACQQQGEVPANRAAPAEANGMAPTPETARSTGAATPTTSLDDSTNTQAPDKASGGETKSILRPDVAPPEPAPPPLEPVTRTIAFGASGTVLDDTGRRTLDDLLHQPVTAAGGRIILRGNTDSRGSDSANLIVSRRMAEAVRDYLVKNGVSRARIDVIALGERRPVAPNAHADGGDDPEGRARNRRVEIEVLLPDTAARPAPEA